MSGAEELIDAALLFRPSAFVVAPPPQPTRLRANPTRTSVTVFWAENIARHRRAGGLTFGLHPRAQAGVASRSASVCNEGLARGPGRRPARSSCARCTRGLCQTQRRQRNKWRTKRPTAALLTAASKRKGACSTVASENFKRKARWLTPRGGKAACVCTRGLTFELTRGRKRAKPAVALRVQRRVRRHRRS